LRCVNGVHSYNHDRVHTVAALAFIFEWKLFWLAILVTSSVSTMGVVSFKVYIEPQNGTKPQSGNYDALVAAEVVGSAGRGEIP
jgi:ABC-type glycerol-3-phosphate transport system permease component